MEVSVCGSPGPALSTSQEPGEKRAPRRACGGGGWGGPLRSAPTLSSAAACGAKAPGQASVPRAHLGQLCCLGSVAAPRPAFSLSRQRRQHLKRKITKN